ncbi:FMN-binding negative transcriptional regulator [Rouxiella badensis]|jgi:transcriptional regulator|uniref:Transcriptional regulator n=1 Tax=Rouxiella badensis TaxID=1646377 RepID=A0A1X0WFD6_9GAMM|nr:FMN-binding negative transcriptional regulator [Rouxiella badensis]MCC3719979.1 FMN-binding negative transcriptional regulator [Rouxiella badensis]MCC3729642.1 FMN-binding negative transcriptional regulator [Rouxiella badensis]MCC3731475.1 FMN-binding negative transcriptional regulator [Rouxiella badensis]MCC3738410.1 FMN-binding negative transcriptional regulator [Rouxiella badensis]MCC3756864.1 FMN-binding negative transcriptional regulator [Rouxiella badensis]
MYVAAPYKESRSEFLYELMEKYPLGTMITYGDPGLDAVHIPFEIAKNAASGDSLRAHVARANPVWKNVPNGAEVLVVFQAGDAYISPNWYPGKHKTHREVPTWNYRAVHVRGHIHFHHDEAFLREMLASLTDRQESTQSSPWRLADAPADYIAAMLKAIVGVEIKITDITASMKLGQNKKYEDLKGAGENVLKTGNEVIGHAMLSHLKIKD